MTGLALTIPSYGGFLADLADVVAVAAAAERHGIGSVVLPDHVAIGPNTDRYPWGRFPLPDDAPWLEPLTTLAAIAGATSSIRLSTGILVAPLRPAALLAKQVATLDVLSRGRVDLAVGAGWQREEFEAVGADHAGRGQALTDAVSVCRALWAGGWVSVDEPTVAFGPVRSEPRPVQERLPVLFAGSLTTRTLDRIVSLGDGWVPIMGSSVDEVVRGVERLRGALADAGRDSERLRVRASVPVRRTASGAVDVDATLEAATDLHRAGVSDPQLTLSSFARTADDVEAGLAAIASSPLAAPT